MSDNVLEDSMLTTLDNPYNPFTQFEEWNAFDQGLGYYTLSYLARVAKTSDELSEADEDLAIDQAMDEILSLNLTGNYVKVIKENWNSVIKERNISK